MEYEQQPNQNDGFINRMKESPRTVSAIIIVVIVAAAIYAFSGNNQNQNPTAQTTPTTAPENSPAASPATSPTPVSQATKSPEAAKDQAKKLPEAKKTDKSYIEVAEKGNGLTHLARKATTRYIADNNVGYTITKEHRIFIEDYVRKHIPSKRVAIGSEQEISFDLLKQAVEAANKLNEKQLQNLTKYTHVLT